MLTPRQQLLAALAKRDARYNVWAPRSPEEVLDDLGGQYVIAIRGHDADTIQDLEARLSDHLRRHFLGTVVALDRDLAVVVRDSTATYKLDRVRFISVI